MRFWHYSPAYGALIYTQDKQGNVVFIQDGSMRVIEKYTYEAFGQPTVRSWSDATASWGAPHGSSAFGNRFMFQGREYFPELIIYDYRHRYYQPSLGRFLQTDPTGFDAGDMNLFRYCGDDPVDRSDPTGLSLNAIGIDDRGEIKAFLRR